MIRTLSLCAALLLSAYNVGAQSTRPPAPSTIGVLPFIDASGASSRDIATALGKTMQTEIANSGVLIAKVVIPDASAQLDGERAVLLGKDHKVEYVFMGTVVSAEANESAKGGWLPRVKGQQLNVRVRSVKAAVVLQGELFDVASGKRVLLARVTGKHSDKAFGGTLWSGLGSWDAGSYSVFLDSPVGKAVRKGIAELVEKTQEAVSAQAKR